MSILTDLLQVFTTITPGILDVYINLFGVPCDIFHPVVEDRFFDDHAKPKYLKIPNERDRQVLIVNFIKSSALRGNMVQFESFFGDGDDRPFIITHEAQRLPPRTRIDAYFGSTKMSFQTETDYVITGCETPNAAGNTIMVKQMLRPLT